MGGIYRKVADGQLLAVLEQLSRGKSSEFMYITTHALTRLRTPEEKADVTANASLVH